MIGFIKRLINSFISKFSKKTITSSSEEESVEILPVSGVSEPIQEEVELVATPYMKAGTILLYPETKKRLS